MPASILDIAFRFNNDHAETSIRQNVGHKNECAKFMMVNVKPSVLMESLTDTHECSSVSLKDGHQRQGGPDQL